MGPEHKRGSTQLVCVRVSQLGGFECAGQPASTILEAPYTLPLWSTTPQNHNKDGLLGPNPTVAVYMEPLDIRL